MEFEIIAEARELQGKSASRRLRREGKVPGILYGAHKDPIAITVDHNELWKKLAHEAFYSHVLTLRMGDSSERVVLKDLQRHPFQMQVLHLDLQRVAEDELITMRVPLHFLNEAASAAVKNQGAVISHLSSDLEIECLPRDLPEFIAVDLQNLEVGTILHASDLTLPEGVRITALVHHGEDTAIVSVHLQRGATSEEGAEGGQA
ncbi:MAG TPA: 50S ribosomal protein L25 [Gammaproteobacteria bacterium]|nr:50S ribosomal protein L25 [Gammaproteobacteria bacterium]